MADLDDEIRGRVRERLAVLELPRLVVPGSLADWLNTLPPDGFGVVVDIVLGRPARPLRWLRANRPDLLADAEKWGVGGSRA